MTPAETAKVLAKAAAYDQRTVGEADVLAWHEIVGDLDFQDALAAVARHYAETDRRLMPVHLRNHANRVRLERVEASPKCAVCGQSTAGRYHERNCGGRRAITAASDRSEDVQRLINELRESLPPSNPRKVRRTEVLEWDRARERALRAQPNPHYDPTAKAVES